MMAIWNAIGALSIMTGGLLSAFTAKKPLRKNMWLSAYLVLVEGCMQVGLAQGLATLNLHADNLNVAAFVFLNLGNAAVMFGTMSKDNTRWWRSLVRSGGALLVISMASLLLGVRSLSLSWTLIWVVLLVGTTLVSMTIGLLISARSRKI